MRSSLSSFYYTSFAHLMDDQAPNYRGEFLKSPHHAALGLLTLGAGFASGMFLPLIAGATCYALGWIYLPDFPLFRHWVDKRRDAVKRAEDAQKVADFVKRREALVGSLSSERRSRYTRLAQVCRDIETATADNLLASADPTTDPRLRKLDELMWTYLRLLGIEQSLEQFLKTEEDEEVPALVKNTETEAAALNGKVEGLKAKGNSSDLDAKQRLLGSCLERLEVLRKRLQRSEQANANLELVRSEQQRLDQQIKLIRADAIATKNAETLTARIDATVEHLDQTNKWLSELDEFKDLVGDIPSTEMRVGYQTAAAPAPASPPPIIEGVPFKKPQPTRQKQSQ
jgi:hypothetical protein